MEVTVITGFLFIPLQFLYIERRANANMILGFPFFFFRLFRAAPMDYRGSQARGPIGAAAAGLPHSHSNTGSEPRLRPAPQLTTTPDP